MRRLIALCLTGYLAAIMLAGCTPKPAQTDAARVEGRGSETAQWWAALPRADWAQYERVIHDTPWFEVYRIRPGVYALYEPGQFEEVISFLIVGRERALLFDTGLGMADIKAAVERLTDKPITVLGSHGHYDHIGGNHQFTDVLGVDNAYAHSRSKGMAHSKVAEYVSPAWLCPDISAPGFSAAHYAIKPYAFSGYVTDGQIIDLGGRTLEVMLIPGHSPDSLALFDRAAGQLYVGDTFYLAPLYAHLEGSDVAKYQAAASRLAALAPQVKDVMTAHNVPIVSPEYLTAMDAAFKSIAADKAQYALSDGAREYTFEGFSILMPD